MLLLALLIPPILEINTEVEADKTAHTYTASIASAYRLSTCEIMLSGINSHDPGCSM
jgi:hypothetical protein